MYRFNTKAMADRAHATYRDAGPVVFDPAGDSNRPYGFVPYLCPCEADHLPYEECTCTACHGSDAIL